MTANIEMIKKVYADLHTKIEVIRKIVGRPLTYAEKILYSHLWEQPTGAATAPQLPPSRSALPAGRPASRPVPTPTTSPR